MALELTSWCSGSTATIVRIPSIHGLDETSDFLCKFSLLLDSYPGDMCFLRFMPPKHLYSIGAAVDVTIWSTVEPGIGIIAGCIATLRPLLQFILWKLGLSSSVPASIPLQCSNKALKRQSPLGYHRSHSLEELRPDNAWMITMATGPQRSWRGRSSSEERIVGKGINKEVVVEQSTEVSGEV